jgi:hypothetical protein
MPAEPVDYSDDRQAVVYVRVPGWLHNLIVRVAEGRGLSVNGWAAVVLKVAAVTVEQFRQPDGGQVWKPVLGFVTMTGQPTQKQIGRAHV